MRSRPNKIIAPGKYLLIHSFFLLFHISLHAQVSNKEVKIEPGVSYSLAQYRHRVISNLQYDLSFDIPASVKELIHASEVLQFQLKSSDVPLQLDFKQADDHIKSIKVNDKKINIATQNEHLIIHPEYLKKGLNTIAIEFIAGDQSLHRNDDYLYALFVPDHARTVFPCFDQPDLKAHFLLTIKAPKEFKVLANAKKRDSIATGNITTYHFDNSDKLSTYLFSFTAGKYTYLKKKMGKQTFEFLHRETDTNKIKLSVDSIFTDHKNAIDFLENWTGISFPFQKAGFVAIPDFQFGGMEHPGEVQYKASSLFLDDGATKDMIIARANLISHETAHMWFGDMVTMVWFNDVWMKEVFANFMADKVSEKIMGTETFNLKFLQDHYPAAYGIDRTRGANPIRQELSNLQDAGSLYGNIIYHKAPIMMRQLETLMGKENFQQGIREYLKKYAYSNATWNDLIAILSRHTKSDLYKWNSVWVNQPGRPVFEFTRTGKGGYINNFTITQKPESGESRIWPQHFLITLVYPDHNKDIKINMNSTSIKVAEVIGRKEPSYVVFNTNGSGYGLFPSDNQHTSAIFEMSNPLQRASAYIVAYENMLAGKFYTPSALLEDFNKTISKEKNEMNLRLISGYMTNIYWSFLSGKERNAIASELESSFWNSLQQNVLPNNKKILFKAYQDIYMSSESKSRIYDIWKMQLPPAGVKLTEEDYTSLALTIALKSDTTTNVLQQQLQRINNIDRKKRLEFIMPALSLDVKERDAFFNSLHDLKNRQKESWVTTALSYLHHPLRQSTSIKYLQKSLEMTEKIQKTGDLFFPQSWLSAIFSNYQSKEAFNIVNDFVNSHPDYPPKLIAKILQSTDHLYRAQNLITK